MTNAVTLQRSVLLEALKAPADLMRGLGALKTRYRPMVCPLAAVLDEIPEGSRLCDIGCGSGSLIFLARKLRHVQTADGYDVSAQAISAAEIFMDMDPGIKAELTSVKQKPDLAGYNVVTMVDVLHHVPRASQAAFLADVASRMDAGAKLILMDIDAGRPLRAMANQLHDLLLSREWVQPVSAKKAFDLLGQATLTPDHPRLFSTLWYGHYLITAVKQG